MTDQDEEPAQDDEKPAEGGTESYGGDEDAESTATEGKSQADEPSERDQAEG